MIISRGIVILLLLLSLCEADINKTIQKESSYIDKTHTIFGDDFDKAPLVKDGEIDLNAHLVNVQYTGLDIAKLEGYGYFLDYNDKESISSQTLGLRFSGAKPLNDDVKVIYTAEFANQDDYKGGTMADQNYYLAEIGGKYNGWLAKPSHEMPRSRRTIVPAETTSDRSSDLTMDE